jgi:hypothetical protein
VQGEAPPPGPERDIGDEANPDVGSMPGHGSEELAGDEAQWAAVERAPQGAEKDPDEWVTGDEPPTGAQLSYLETPAREAGEDVPEGLTKAQASKLIDELQQRTGRGV